MRERKRNKIVSATHKGHCLLTPDEDHSCDSHSHAPSRHAALPVSHATGQTLCASQASEKLAIPRLQESFTHSNVN